MNLVKIFFIQLILILCFISGVSAKTFTESEKAQIFLKANEFYQKGDFNRAKENYEKLIESGLRNGYLFYNLGNTYTRLNNKGKAILNYDRAKLFIPRNADLDSNLTYVQGKIEDKIDVSQNRQILKEVFFWYDSFNTSELLTIFLILWSLFFILAILKIFMPNTLVRRTFITFVILSLIFGTTYLIKGINSIENNRAIVMQAEASVKTGIDVESITIFKVHEGTELKVLQKEKDWFKVQLSKDKRGWIQKDSLEII